MYSNIKRNYWLLVVIWKTSFYTQLFVNILIRGSVKYLKLHSLTICCLNLKNKTSFYTDLMLFKEIYHHLALAISKNLDRTRPTKEIIAMNLVGNIYSSGVFYLYKIVNNGGVFGGSPRICNSDWQQILIFRRKQTDFVEIFRNWRVKATLVIFTF